MVKSLNQMIKAVNQLADGTGDPHIGQLLRDGLRRFESDLLGRLAEGPGPGLRLSHAALLRHLDVEGTRASVLADRAGLSRQAVTQLVDDLERLGYVTREACAEDGRGRIVVYTETGRAVFGVSRELIAGLEREYEAALGGRRYKALRSGLEELALSRPRAPRS